MTDTEKERELPEEGMDMNKENLVEQVEKKESSLAADQESVTGNNNPNSLINGSSNEEDGSSKKNELQEANSNDTAEDPSVSKTPDIDTESTPPSGSKLAGEENAPESETESSEDVSPQDNESGEEIKSTEDVSEADRIENKEESHVKTDPQGIRDEPQIVDAESQEATTKPQDVVDEPQDIKADLQGTKDLPGDAREESQTTEMAPQDEKEEPQVINDESQVVKDEPLTIEAEPQEIKTESQDAEAEQQDAKDVAHNDKDNTQTAEAKPIEIKKESQDIETELQDTTDVPQDTKDDTQTAEAKPKIIEKDSQALEKDPESEAKVENINKAEPSENAAEVDSKTESSNLEKADDKSSKIEDEKEGAGTGEDGKEKVHPEEEIEEEKDYSLLKKDELINEFEVLLKTDDLKLAEKKIKELKPFYQEIVESEKKEALQKYLDDGGVEIDFKYIGDALDSRYANLNDKYKGRRNAYYSELEKSKEDNLTRKQDILEKLRAIVDGEETNASISALKNITKEWRSIGPVPSAYAKSMWATYNILIDRFYDNRSIYFELKELDRKKNLESKLELCEKAENLLEYDVIRDAVKELNELHEEFKHIGPVPKEMQEVVWQRFKSASDAIYNRRKDYVSGLKKELHENFESKKQLVDEVAKFDEFDSEKISDWNEKTKEILDLQKKWEVIGGLPREHAKEVNKHFWSSFKSFFNNKNKFFKKLESQRDENLLKKEDLVKRADELKESNDWEKTADQLKELQKEWKDIGPVPEKNRNEVYKKFKKACDSFFNKRREHSKEVESEYKVNLRKKEEVCVEIEKMVADKEKNIDRFKELQVLYNGIGFVPRNTIKKIHKKYNKATELFLNSFDLSDTEKSELRFAAEVDKLKASPNADKRIYRKEIEVKRQISKIENDIALWKNNIEFFAKSKTADKVREEFNEKIAKATSQLHELREELKVLNKI